jgi:invasion protein IalB
MRHAQVSDIGWFAGVLVLALASTASAQQPRPPAAAPPAAPAAPEPPVSDTPTHTTASYANWVLSCDTVPGPPPQKTCEIAQIVQAQAQGRTAPFSRISIAHPVKGQPVKLTVQVLPSVVFSTAVRLQAADNDTGISVPFARCALTGCFADFDIKDDMMRKFRAATGNGKVTYADFTGKEVVVPLSFSGFTQAFDALAKE